MFWPVELLKVAAAAWHDTLTPCVVVFIFRATVVVVAHTKPGRLARERTSSKSRLRVCDMLSSSCEKLRK